jgi:lipoprotein NlpD
VESRSSEGTAKTSGRPATYRVRKGDSLTVIAWRWGLDWRELAAWNDIRHPYTIYPGQRLRLQPGQNDSRSRASRSSAGSVPKAKMQSTQPVRNPVPAPRTTGRKELSSVGTAKRDPGFVEDLRWRWPVQGRLLSSYAAADEKRQGIKIGGDQGRAITAAESGKVVYSGSGLIGYGRLIIIKHNNEFLSAYGHNRRLLVKEGDWVTKGDKIAEMGLANGGQPMLHFEIRRNGKPVNPMSLLPRRSAG